MHALSQLRNGSAKAIEAHTKAQVSEPGRTVVEIHSDVLEGTADDTSKSAPNKLITDYFRGSASERKKVCTTSRDPHAVTKKLSSSGRKQAVVKNHVTYGKHRDPPLWCCIPGTPFRVVNDFSVNNVICLFIFALTPHST